MDRIATLAIALILLGMTQNIWVAALVTAVAWSLLSLVVALFGNVAAGPKERHEGGPKTPARMRRPFQNRPPVNQPRPAPFIRAASRASSL